jgi:hypothetical protein
MTVVLSRSYHFLEAAPSSLEWNRISFQRQESLMTEARGKIKGERRLWPART